MKILFDTNIVSYWHSGEPRFKIPLSHFVRKTVKSNKNISLYVSVITIHELACWLRPSGKWETVRQWMNTKFATPLPFCEVCANKAADFQIRSGPPGKASEAEKAQWHHDVAIVGTAARHGLDAIVTSDKTMYRRYGSLFNEIVVIEAVGS